MVRALILSALDDHAYAVRPAARTLGVTEGRLRALIGQLGLTEIARERGPGRGAPRGPRKSAKKQVKK
jgi:hypothetical protein